MEWFVGWILEHPLERVVLCVETVLLVIGGPLAWWHRIGLKKNISSLKADSADLKADMRKMIAMMQEMIDKPTEEQRQILQKASEVAKAHDTIVIADTIDAELNVRND